MPRRLITSEIWTNEKFGALDLLGRLVFVGLITHADDDGRLKGSPNYLKAKIFPYDLDVTAPRINELLDRCHELNLIIRYNMNGSEYIYLIGWAEHQQIRGDRYKKSTLPAPPINQESTDGIPDGNQETTNGKRNIIEVNISKYNIIYTTWNEQNIITHNKLTDDMKGAINTAIRNHTEEEICQSIRNYTEILKSDLYYFKYSWTLKDFLKRGLEKFIDLEIAKSNYKKDGDLKGSAKAKKDDNRPRRYQAIN